MHSADINQLRGFVAGGWVAGWVGGRVACLRGQVLLKDRLHFTRRPSLPCLPINMPPAFTPVRVAELKEKFVRLPLHSGLVEQLAAAIQAPGFVARQQVCRAAGQWLLRANLSAMPIAGCVPLGHAAAGADAVSKCCRCLPLMLL